MEYYINNEYFPKCNIKKNICTMSFTNFFHASMYKTGFITVLFLESDLHFLSAS